MKTIYLIYDAKQPDGAWFKAYEVPDELTLPYGYIDVAPPSELVNPRYVYGQGWVEDDSAAMESLEKENAELKSRIEMAEGALLDLADMILTR